MEKIEKMNLIAKVFEAVKTIDNDFNYTVNFHDNTLSYYKSCNYLYTINPIHTFNMSTTPIYIKAFFLQNYLVFRLAHNDTEYIKYNKYINEDEVDDKYSLIYVCLHEIGHSYYNNRLKDLNEKEYNTYLEFRKMFFANEIFHRFNMSEKNLNIIYKTFFNELYADLFAYSRIAKVLEIMGIENELLKINPRKNSNGNKNINGRKIVKYIEKMYNTNNTTKVQSFKTFIKNFDKNDNINKYIVFFIDSLFDNEDDRELGYYLIKTLFIDIHVYKKITDTKEEFNLILKFIMTQQELYNMISNKYKNKKWIDKDWHKISTYNINIVNFINIWNLLVKNDII